MRFPCIVVFSSRGDLCRGCSSVSHSNTHCTLFPQASCRYRFWLVLPVTGLLPKFTLAGWRSELKKRKERERLQSDQDARSVMTTSSEEKRERRRYCTTRKATKRARHARAVVAITRKSGSKTGRKEKSRAVFFSFGELKVTDKQTESKGHLFPWQSPVK